MNEVYAIDMLISTGDGKSRDMDFRTTIYKREPDQVYQLKMKASRGECTIKMKEFKLLKLLWQVIFVNDTELLRLPHYRIRQTIAQSKRLDD